ncbi:MAG: branched-chain amino acid ABC transporter permease [Bacillati bacterium ANGP1]|uniref:Branched-chain amino acid ABC transporter permease n=1 Tax=Candidatus Segetimicrobium genomatis TaxID=2569760 RepID=A0A537M8C5_9BACT|nr:MAG: branched-chain amino acid ABC transporter permease [Terrabacteria group bacterium ANGP1]
MEIVLVQVFNGLISGAFYALLSLGLAVIFGMLRVVNFMHGALYMLGAFGAYLLGTQLGVSFWWALIISPLAVAAVGFLLERALLRRLYDLNILYNLLLTFGLTLVIQDAMRLRFGVQGVPYSIPSQLRGAVLIGFMFFPTYRLFVLAFSVLVCLSVWWLIERTRVGMIIRASTEDPVLTRALGVDVDRWIPLVFAFGVALAGLAGVLAAPMRNISPLMGADLIITTFAIVVIGGMGSILGSVVTGFVVGVLSALGAVYYPPAANTLVFVLMAVVLLLRPSGLFGSPEAG